MSPDHLQKTLQEKFSIISYTDLSLIIQKPSTGYKIFKDLRKPVFAPDERLIFYSNGHVGSNIVAYLSHASNLFDIDKCFILVCAKSHDPALLQEGFDFFFADLESPIVIDEQMISVDTLCPLPWIHACIEQNGDLKTCCWAGDTIKKYNDPGTLQSAFQSEKLQKLREDLRHGKHPKECQACWQLEDKGLISGRQWHIKTHKDIFLTDCLDDPKIKSLEVSPRNICNFKCRICGVENSSQWVAEELAHEQDPIKKQKLYRLSSELNWFDGESQMSRDVIDLIPDLEFIDIFGGEPLIHKEFEQIIKKSVESGASKQQRLHFNTNTSVFPENLINQMQQFKEVTISLSIDNIGTRFEVERGGDWGTIERNVDRFLACDPDIFKISVLTVVSNLNLLYLDDLVSWAEGKNLQVMFQILRRPEHLKYTEITSEVRDLVIKKYQFHHNETLRAIANDMKNIQPIEGTKWVEKMKTLDSRRDQNLLDSHHDLATRMGYRSIHND